ncbi:MAG: hypothetical protein IT447_15190 [Phycisphaerales bacterium]|nr:hypothetical protein [Phycisphaerales bacterium]
MDQATLDLPDPQSVAPHDSTASADDLLSQMAGEEIDRLLADADVNSTVEEAPSPVNQEPDDAEPAVEPTATSESESESEPEVDDLFQSDAMAFASPDLTLPEIQTQLSSELDQLFETLNTPEPTPQDEPPAVEQPVESANDAESGALLEASQQIQDEADATAALLESIEPTNAPSPLPIWLRPLEWLDSPLSGLTDSARSILGKAALVTLFNAIVILTYVLLFRKH